MNPPFPLTPSYTLTANAHEVLAARYLGRDADGTIVETPDQLFDRVAATVAAAEAAYAPAAQAPVVVERWRARFRDLMAAGDFLPNSPALGNAGRGGMLSACYVIPVEDSLEDIFEAVKRAALIWQSGGGTGFDFSRLRPRGFPVRGATGVASGPISFMHVFDAAADAIKQGGQRRAALMAVLWCDHPDLDAFLSVKDGQDCLQNFNISVAVTDGFMAALAGGGPYALRWAQCCASEASSCREGTCAAIDADSDVPRYLYPQEWGGAVVRWRDAREVWAKLMTHAHKTGDPGVLFLERANTSRSNPVPALGPLRACNPCSEQILYDNDSCNLGSINLGHFVRDLPAHVDMAAPIPEGGVRVVGTPAGRDVDWDRLKRVVEDCTRFLDDVIDVNVYPIAAIAETTRQIRRIGLGVMGWADMLFQLGIPYDSREAVALADAVMGLVQEYADRASLSLARERGPFPAWEESIYGPDAAGPDRNTLMRNSCRTNSAPTGTLSILADCIGGIEPAFSLAFLRQHRLDKRDPTKVTSMVEVNKHFAAVARARGFYSDGLITFLLAGGALRDRPEVPDDVKRVFVTAHDVSPEWHVRMQAAFQRHVDNSLSKTVNLPNNAVVEDVDRVYRLAWELGCKGVTVYRDGTYAVQVLTHTQPAEVVLPVGTMAALLTEPVFAHHEEVCPDCPDRQVMYRTDGCWHCPRCGLSYCG